jgi:hypothetical protein
VQNIARKSRGAARVIALLGIAAVALTAAPGANATVPRTLKYQDSDGPGQIILSEFAPDPATGGGRIMVQLSQNGQTFSGTGFTLRVHEDPPNQSDRVFIDLVVFTIRDRFGRAFLFRGKLQTGGIAGRLIGSGRYELVGGSDVDQWTITE